MKLRLVVIVCLLLTSCIPRIFRPEQCYSLFEKVLEATSNYQEAVIAYNDCREDNF